MEHVSSFRPTGKFPEKEENLKRWASFPARNFRTECRVPFTFLVVCTRSRSTVGHRDVLGFTTKWNNLYQSEIPLLLPPKFPGFFPKWKAPFVMEISLYYQLCFGINSQTDLLNLYFTANMYIAVMLTILQGFPTPSTQAWLYYFFDEYHRLAFCTKCQNWKGT